MDLLGGPAFYKKAGIPESKKERTHESTNLNLTGKDAGKY
jgi:hypothetical protein